MEGLSEVHTFFPTAFLLFLLRILALSSWNLASCLVRGVRLVRDNTHTEFYKARLSNRISGPMSAGETKVGDLASSGLHLVADRPLEIDKDDEVQTIVSRAS